MRPHGSGRWGITVLIALVLVSGRELVGEAAPSVGAPLTVAAASDLQPAFLEIGHAFTAATGQTVTFVFDSTGNLARQIEHGAPVDVFAAAGPRYVDELEAKGLIFADSRHLFARGRLALVASSTGSVRVMSLGELLQPEFTHIALANPTHAPYGLAAKQALEAAGLWGTLQPKLVYAENVRQAARFVATGSATAGLVALSLAKSFKLNYALVDARLHAPLAQELVIISRTQQEAAARQFITFVGQAESRLILQRYGFELLPPAGTQSTAEVIRTSGAEVVHPLHASFDLFPLYLSVKVAMLTTALCFLLGLVVAWLLARKNFPAKDLLDGLSTLPQLLPPSVLGYYLLVVLSHNSGLGQFLESTIGLRLAFTWEGAVVAASVLAFPLMVQSLRVALEGVDTRLEEVARTLGRSDWEVFLTITIPLAWRGIMSGIILTFTRALGEFGATLMLAANIPGRTQTLSLAIYDAVQTGDGSRAALLVVIVTGLTGALLLTVRQVGRGTRGQRCSM